MILVTVLITIEIPFTDDCLGMPGLSYVRSAAEVSLNIVKPHASTNGLVQKLTRGRLPFLALSTSNHAAESHRQVRRAASALDRTGG